MNCPNGRVAGEAIRPRGPRGYEVDWRDPFFRKAVSFSALSGEVRRREILMEAEPEDDLAAPGAAIEITPEIRQAQMKALDQLDGLRRSGEITEGDFQRRRRLVLEGRLEEAGYEPTP